MYFFGPGSRECFNGEGGSGCFNSQGGLGALVDYVVGDVSVYRVVLGV